MLDWRQILRKKAGGILLMKIDNLELVDEIAKSKAKGRITDRLGELLMEMVESFATTPRFREYSIIEDMKGEALVVLVANITKFDPNKSSNAFSFATKTIENSFKHTIKMEKKKHWDLEDKIKANLDEF